VVNGLNDPKFPKILPDNLFAFPFISLSIAEGFQELEVSKVIVPKVEAFRKEEAYVKAGSQV
jgi:hypothetical protein